MGLRADHQNDEKGICLAEEERKGVRCMIDVRKSRC